MQVHMVHPETGEYCGLRTLPVDPLETKKAGHIMYARPGRFDTLTPPPPTPIGWCPVWDGDAWSLVLDCRGQIWWSADGTMVTVTALGNPQDFGLRKDRPSLVARVAKRVRGVFDAIMERF